MENLYYICGEQTITTMTDEEYNQAMAQAEEEAHLFLSDVQTDYNAFLESARTGRLTGAEVDGASYVFSSGKLTTSKARISRNGGKWIVYDGAEEILCLTIPKHVCEAVISLVESGENGSTSSISNNSSTSSNCK